jgi:inhibitor of KinA sporulation pathway (predicted exonuclease)
MGIVRIPRFEDRFLTTAVIYDLEFTAWEGSMRHRWLRPGEFKEVVQIGAVKLDAHSLAVVGTFSAFVRPRINPVLSPYLERLTGITNAVLRGEGCDFAQAYGAFLHFAGDAVCASYGRDELVFEDNLRLYGLPQPANPPSYVDLSLWFRASGLEIRGLHSSDIGPKLGVPLDGHAHNALADSLSLAAGMGVLVARGAPNLFAPQGVAAKTAA